MCCKVRLSCLWRCATWSSAAVLLAVIVYNGWVTFWHFIYFGLFNGTLLALSMPARAAATPEIVPRETLTNAMALSSATFNLARVFGPVIAGAMIAVLAAGDTTSAESVGIVFFAIAALYFLSVVSVLFIDYTGAPAARAATLGVDGEARQSLVAERV